MTTRFIMIYIDLRHQYAISAAEMQMFLHVKHPSGAEWGETAVFRRQSMYINFIIPAL